MGINVLLYNQSFKNLYTSFESRGISVDFKGSWHHFAVTFDGLDVKCYVDGNVGLKTMLF